MMRRKGDPERKRQRHGATLLGMTEQAYREFVRRDLKWCSGHRAWEKQSTFGPHRNYSDGLNSICRAWDRQSSRNRQRAYRAAARAAS